MTGFGGWGCSRLRPGLTSGAEEVAEKGQLSGQRPQKSMPQGLKRLRKKVEIRAKNPKSIPQRLKPIRYFVALMARLKLKSCPFKAKGFSAACKAHQYLSTIHGTTEVVPFQSKRFFRSL
jgi:hypothetical protein